MNSFYIAGAGAPGARAELLPEEARHAAQVLRLRPGEEICAVDANGRRFAARIEEVSRDGCTALLGVRLPDNESSLRVCVYQGLPKGDKLDFIVQKLTELGAAKIVPVRMARSVAKLNARDGEKRRERLQRIAREAAKQCGRARAPEVSPPQSWREAEEALRSHELLLAPWEEEKGFSLRAARDAAPGIRDIGIVIGPEGGMSADEVAALEGLGAKALTLGPRILRTETAAVAACALAQYLWGDLG